MIWTYQRGVHQTEGYRIVETPKGCIAIRYIATTDYLGRGLSLKQAKRICERDAERRAEMPIMGVA